MRKGIILAGGTGSRLYPATLAVSKQLLPVYDKPMIYYPLSTLMLAGIREVLIISTPEDTPRFKKLLGSGERLGMSFNYQVQDSANGIPEAFILGESYLDGDCSALILGDNIFYGNMLQDELRLASDRREGCTIFTYKVRDPERYGIANFKGNQLVELDEKPLKPKSNEAVTGLYFFDENVVDLAKELRPSPRGETEIIDLLKIYASSNAAQAVRLGRGHAWLDTGTHESLMQANQFISALEGRQGLKISCIEEIAYRSGFINIEQLEDLVAGYYTCPYKEYLTMLVSSEKTDL